MRKIELEVGDKLTGLLYVWTILAVIIYAVETL